MPLVLYGCQSYACAPVVQTSRISPKIVGLTGFTVAQSGLSQEVYRLLGLEKESDRKGHYTAL